MPCFRSISWFVLLAPFLLLLSACESGKKSRFDDVAGVNICELISPAEVEHILGPIEKTTSNSSTSVAGDCTWTFTRLNSRQTSTLNVVMMTQASSLYGPSPARFMEISQPEIMASLGASPWPVPDLGDRASLYQTRLPEVSELWMLQSSTLLILRMNGGSAAQAAEIAKAMSRELEPVDGGS